MGSKRAGRQTIRFSSPPVVESFANIGGKEEGRGPLAEYFDELGEDSYFDRTTWEKGESEMQKRVIYRALEKKNLKPADVDVIFAGDLQNQCIGTSFSLRDVGIPLYGIIHSVFLYLHLVPLTFYLYRHILYQYDIHPLYLLFLQLPFRQVLKMLQPLNLSPLPLRHLIYPCLLLLHFSHLFLYLLPFLLILVHT